MRLHLGCWFQLAFCTFCKWQSCGRKKLLISCVHCALKKMRNILFAFKVKLKALHSWDSSLGGTLSVDAECPILYRHEITSGGGRVKIYRLTFFVG